MSIEQLSQEKGRPALHWWPWYFVLGALEGLGALIWLALIPTDPKNAALLEYSSSRLVLMVGTLVMSLVLFGLGWAVWRHADWREKWLRAERRQGLFNAGIVLGFGLALASWGTLFYLRYYPEAKYLAYYERFLPLLGWMLLLGLQGALWLAVLRFGLHRENLKEYRRWLMPLGIIMALLVLLWVFIALTGIGITPDSVAWNTPGVPLYEWQLWLAWLAGMVLLVLGLGNKMLSKQGGKTWVFDVLMALALWGLAVGLWMQQPVPYSFFTPKVLPPNYEVYPYSDAANHDIVAQHILVGDGFMGDRVTKRPGLSVFLAALHVAGGQDYDQVIFLQTLFLAAFPVILYFLGKAVHSRSLGVMLGLLTVLRELNIIAASPFSRVSHSKMLMSDIPAAIGIALFSLLVVLWLRNPGRRRLIPLAAGGVMGLLMLVRTQSVLLVFFMLAAALLASGWRWKLWLQGALLMGAGILLSILPWLGRNYVVTGRVVFDQTEQTGIFAQRYTDLPGYSMPPREPGESEEAYTQRMVSDTWRYTVSHPGAVAGFITAHFLNNEIDSVLVMPLRTGFNDLEDVFQVTRSFWDDWSGIASGKEGVTLALILLTTAVGIAGSWRRWGVVGLVPLLANLAYSLSNALVRNSGGRYILPVDWIGYVYFALGLLELSLAVLLAFGLRPERAVGAMTSQTAHEDSSAARPLLWRGVWIGLFFLAIGATLPLAEVVFPVRYAEPSKAQAAASLLASETVQDSGLDLDKLADFMAQEGTEVLEGRVMYPRYYEGGEGEPGAGWAIYSLQDYSRMGFKLVGPSARSSVIRLQEPPEYFPNAADVILVGCPTENFLDVALVTVLGGDEVTYLRAGEPVYNCGE